MFSSELSKTSIYQDVTKINQQFGENIEDVIVTYQDYTILAFNLL